MSKFQETALRAGVAASVCSCVRAAGRRRRRVGVARACLGPSVCVSCVDAFPRLCCKSASARLASRVCSSPRPLYLTQPPPLPLRLGFFTLLNHHPPSHTHFNMSARPQNVGIKAIEIYFPRRVSVPPVPSAPCGTRSTMTTTSYDLGRRHVCCDPASR